MIKLTADIRSAFNSTVIYGNKNEEVKIVDSHGEVIIVENKDGNRFPVKKQFLSYGEEISDACKSAEPPPCTDSLEEKATGELRKEKRPKATKRDRQPATPSLF